MQSEYDFSKFQVATLSFHKIRFLDRNKSSFKALTCKSFSLICTKYASSICLFKNFMNQLIYFEEISGN